MKRDDGIAVVVLTHNREHLIAKCVENVLLRTSEATREIVIWDNASTDGTRDYLATIDDLRLRSSAASATSVRAPMRAPSVRPRRRI